MEVPPPSFQLSHVGPLLLSLGFGVQQAGHLQSISGWQSGDASGFLPLLHVPLSPVARVIGDTFGFLPQPTGPVQATLQSMNKDAKDFPSWWTKSPNLFDTPTQLCLTLRFLYRISFTNGSVYQGSRFLYLSHNKLYRV